MKFEYCTHFSWTLLVQYICITKKKHKSCKQFKPFKLDKASYISCSMRRGHHWNFSVLQGNVTTFNPRRF